MQRVISVLFMLFVAVALCSFDTAGAQTITVGQSKISLYAATGGFSQVESLSISASSTPLVYELNVQSAGGWLSTSASGGNLPATVLVSANASQLQNGTYYGSITVFAKDNPDVLPVTIQVTLYVGSGTTAAITVSPVQLEFEGQAYGSSTAAKYLNIKGVTKNVSFYAGVTTADGNAWLQVNPISGTTPASIAVTANPGALPAGQYDGTITITPLEGPSVQVEVSFTVAGSNVVKVNPTALRFYYEVGKAKPEEQRLDFIAVDAPVNITLKLTTASGGSWLTAAPTVFPTPHSAYVSVSTSGLPVGEYDGNISVMTQGESIPAFSVPVKLTIGNAPLLTVSGSLSPFNYELAGDPPAGQILTIGSSSTPLNFQVTTGTSDSSGWLMVGPLSGTTPATLSVGVNAANLEPGTYTGTITVSSPQAGNDPQTVQVTLNVGGAASVNVSPGSLYFGYQLNGSNPPPAQTLSITSNGNPVGIWVSPSMPDCNLGWLQLSPSAATTPANIGVSVNTNYITAPQICNGSIAISGPELPTITRVPATLLVSNQALLNITPQAIRLATQYGGAIAGTTAIDLTTTNNTALSYTAVASTTNGDPQWLTVGPGSGNAPATLSVGVRTSSLTPGTYSGAIAIHSPGLPTPMSVPVVVTITPITSVVATPNNVRFTQVQGGAKPASQQISITTTDGSSIAYTASATTTVGSGWLSVAASSGATPGAVAVTASAVAGMAPGTYTGYVSITSPAAKNSPYRIPVTFVLSAPAATISAAPTSLSFTSGKGSALNPDPQTVRITAAGATAVSFSAGATVTSGGSWLSVSPASGSTPADLTVSVKPAGLEAGTYSGEIAVTPSAGVANPVSIPVSLVVSAQPAPALAAIVNAASGKTGPIAPGEIITITGQGLGPDDGLGYQIGESGKLDTLVGSVRVLFGEFQAPLLYVSAAQINAIVPYELAGRPNTQVIVENHGVRSVATGVGIVGSAPGIFTSSMGGSGQAAILNQDNSYNGSAIPAARGSVIQVFATGEGQTDPAGVTAGITKLDVSRPLLPVTATVGGIPARVMYAGSAPMSVAGLFQVNVVVPDNAPAGDVPIVITVGEGATQEAATVAIK